MLFVRPVPTPNRSPFFSPLGTTNKGKSRGVGRADTQNETRVKENYLLAFNLPLYFLFFHDALKVAFVLGL